MRSKNSSFIGESIASKKKLFRIGQIAACPFPADHGTPGAIREIVNVLAEWGHKIHIVTYPIKKNLYLHPAIRVHRIGKEREAPIRVGPFLTRFFYDAIMPLTIVRVVQKYNLQIIHGHNYESLAACIAAKKFCNRPLIYNAINLMEEELPTYNFLGSRRLSRILGKFLDYYLPKKADFIIANTERLKKFFLARGIPENKIEVVPTGIDVEFFRSGDDKKTRKRFSLENKKVLLYTGTFDAFQGLELLLESFVYVAQEIPSAVLLLVGGGTVTPEQEAFYRKKSRRLNIIERVIFAKASLKEVPDYLAVADVAVCPRPSSAGMPVKVLNYLAAKRPVVAFKNAAPFLKHGKEAWLVEKVSPQEFAQAMVKILTEESKAQELAEEGFKTVKSKFSLNIVCQKLVKIYASILNQ